MSLYTVRSDAESEFSEKKSVFIGHVFFVSEEEEANMKIKEIKEKYSDATHNCWAYSLSKFSARRFSDDGEPQGTAGKPILAAIDNNGLTDVCVVVTRYFGGTLLGAGGLVRAYTRSAVSAIENAGKAEIIPVITFSSEFPYERLNRVKTVMSRYPAEILKEDYGEKIRIELSLAKDEFERFEAEIKSYYYDFECTVLSENKGRRPVKE